MELRFGIRDPIPWYSTITRSSLSQYRALPFFFYNKHALFQQQAADKSLTWFKTTEDSASCNGHWVTCAPLEQEQGTVRELGGDCERACRAKVSAVWFWDLWILRMVLFVLRVQLANIWVNGLILHSGGLPWSEALRKCTSCWLSERKWTCWRLSVTRWCYDLVQHQNLDPKRFIEKIFSDF